MTIDPELRRFIAEGGTVTHLARSKHGRTLCGWDMLYSGGLPREVPASSETMPRCPRCEAKQHG